MGNILMDVRDIIHTYQQEFPPLPSAPAPPPPTPTTDDRECTESPSTIVIGNSNTRGLAKEISARGLECTGFVYPGQTIKQIKSRVAYVSRSTPPSAVVCHAGDIEVRDQSCTVESIVSDYSEHSFQVCKITSHHWWPSLRSFITKIADEFENLGSKRTLGIVLQYNGELCVSLQLEGKT